MQFSQLTIHPELLAAIQDMQLDELTEIQEKTFRPAIEGCDLAGAAQTGTGKTIAFLMPILSRIFSEDFPTPTALVITPTRELCIQIAQEAEKLCKRHPIHILSLYGGEAYKAQEAALAKKPVLLVATPGRLVDYVKQNRIRIRTLSFLVLDEADRMFDMGFIRDVRFILRMLSPKAQIMLFSATLSYSAMRLAREYMKEDLVEIRTETKKVTVDAVEQQLYHLGRSEKGPYLFHQITAAKQAKVIVFTNFRHQVLEISRMLNNYAIPAQGISSLLDQKKRVRLLEAFKAGKYSVLVATDLASRGLDIDDLSHVFNYDLPQDAEAYVHRIGRTARAGKSGLSISYCSEADYEYLPRIQRYLGSKIPVFPINSAYLQFPPKTAIAERGLQESSKKRKNKNSEAAPSRLQNEAQRRQGQQRKGRARKAYQPRSRSLNQEKAAPKNQRSMRPARDKAGSLQKTKKQSLWKKVRDLLGQQKRA